jgi:23S rRNA pseudouridine1911/1915/1917 synthase
MKTEDTLLTVAEPMPLMKFLIASLKHKSRDNIKSLLKNKQIWIEGRAISQFDYALVQGQQVTVKWTRVSEPELYRQLNIIFEDDHIAVIDKSAGLLSISAGKEHETAYSILSRHVKLADPAARIFVVHRLDRETSGLMMFAKSEAVQETLQKGWQTNIRERTYIALVEGQPQENEGTIRSYLFESKAFIVHSSTDPNKGELAITHYTTLKSSKDYALLEVQLETGKKNQIRVHMQDIGHPVAGDKKYGAKTNPVGRLGLHAAVLAFVHPVTGENMRFVSKTPPRFLRMF